ncbi:hypothetical protein VF04_38010 [Nostoc linckia z7]|uniref:Uncharacterized protein n=1 Tax=Nostoc linckia z7 TaxID=1628745 RepID=A0ABX4KC65_NOSLI|nr:hypothetical protein [Nostoc linckia]PHJ52339.1 hypothetical protein VF02_37650 [Nostoc linckia z1]PHJ59326.1 hypothetical protein VF05_32565 [Nostoc linckia z3]PHJ63651.1 hypothetical protein VF03_30075 [Nostoc linckia z2]PHJ80185.1 hypothetical protein VF04_38010 [Nostoc linckia z7]
MITNEELQLKARMDCVRIAKEIIFSPDAVGVIDYDDRRRQNFEYITERIADFVIKGQFETDLKNI